MQKLTKKTTNCKELTNNIKIIAALGLFMVDIKPSCVYGSKLIDFSSDWMITKPKTCTCLENVSFPFCSCNSKFMKKVSLPPCALF